MTAHSDGDDPRLADLLLRWEEQHDQGQSLSAEELCSTCPELAGELGRRIALLRQLDPLLHGTTTADGRHPRPPTVAAPRRESATARAEFHDLRFHAAGALGEVFRARNAELNREVALKFLKPERTSDADSRRRFLQEAEVTGRLEHPGVVPIYALGTDATGSPCYAMRFIRGETLQDAIDAFHAAEKPGRDPSERSLALRDLLNRFVSICNTMGYAHSRGILHRDLKPRNVMLGKYDETLVVDWGLAKPFERDEAARSVGEETLTPGSGSDGSGSDTPTVGVIGTPAYMSPEQAGARWDLVGPASDLFSLGGILYAILTGQAPYQGRKVGEILEKVKRCEFPAPRQVKPQVSRSLEAICLKAMARRPEDRYATALEMAADVRRWLADEPVAAYPEPMMARARRWMRRHRTLVTSAAAALIFGLAVMVGFATLLADKNRELDAKNVALADKNRQLDAKNVELADKYQELDRQRRRAEERETLAIDAVKTFRDAVQVNPELKNDPKLDALRKALLKEPLEFFRKLRDQLQSDRDTRPEALEKLASANLELAKTTSEIGSYPDASRSYSEAIDLLESLVRDHPGVPQYQDKLARAHGVRGVLLLTTGQPPEALRAMQRSQEIRERLVRDNPSNTQFQSDLALVREAVGVLLAASDRPTEAMEFHQQALKAGQVLARANTSTIDFQSRLAFNHHFTAALLQKQGRVAEAITSSQRALAICERLARDNPTNPDLQYHLAVAHSLNGLLQRDARRQPEAIASYQRAVVICEPLAHDNPAVTNYQFTLASILDGMGRSLYDIGKYAEASAALRRSVEIRERLARDNPAVTRFLPDLAETHGILGSALWFTGDYQNSAEAHRRAIAIYSKLLTAKPKDLAYRDGAAENQRNLGVALWRSGDRAGAAESFREAIATWKTLVEAAPNTPGYHISLGRALNNLGAVFQDLGRYDDAVLPLRQAIDQNRMAFDREPQVIERRRFLSESYQFLARGLRASHRAVEAAQVARARLALWEGTPDEIYNVACDIALCVPIVEHSAQRQALAAEAVQTLKRSIAAGWSNAVHTSRDPDLIPLRDRDDFRRLLAEMFDHGFPADPFAR